MFVQTMIPCPRVRPQGGLSSFTWAYITVFFGSKIFSRTPQIKFAETLKYLIVTPVARVGPL